MSNNDLIYMKPAPGVAAPVPLMLPGGVNVYPDSSGRYQVAAKFVSQLRKSNWQASSDGVNFYP
jgi:hypothetical protein